MQKIKKRVQISFSSFSNDMKNITSQAIILFFVTQTVTYLLFYSCIKMWCCIVRKYKKNCYCYVVSLFRKRISHCATRLQLCNFLLLLRCLRHRPANEDTVAFNLHSAKKCLSFTPTTYIHPSIHPASAQTGSVAYVCRYIIKLPTCLNAI